MKRIVYTATFGLTFLLNACASLSEQECLNADWSMIGQEDASIGRSVTTLSNHRKACAKVNIIPNQTQYEQGYQRGLLHYCTYTNGQTLASNGGHFFEACSEPQATDFLAGFEHGQKIHATKQAVATLKREIQTLNSALEDSLLQIKELEETLIQGDGNEGSRRDALTEIDRLQLTAKDSRTALLALERRLKSQQRLLQSLTR
ncbi:DUF2799 domain-containing protein [Teredinibacter purpureus]|uniref:DUF2799 domain-containing protein n=1 Tax=Teredinibacter purpureus TaxID=2731756 RepID=UPI0005F7AEF0|nr:DUF2799 domain-containing protein [Teredinibacter purpureus]